MPSDFCAGCGTEHHWLACPEVSQSVFPHDPEWDAEEPPPPMVANVPMGPPWDPGTPEWDRDCPETGQLPSTDSWIKRHFFAGNS